MKALCVIYSILEIPAGADGFLPRVAHDSGGDVMKTVMTFMT